MSDTTMMGQPDPMGLPPDPTAAPDPNMAANTFMPREQADPPEARRKLVKRWQDRVKRAKRHWKKDFARMRDNMAFVEGKQWPDMTFMDGTRDDRYIANICLRHIQQRTAELYPTNPTMKATRREKLMAKTWDGSAQSLMQAQQTLAMGMQYGMPPDPNAQAILMDATQVHQWQQLMDRIGKTLEILYSYNIDEQNFSFKECMKMTVRRALITGVGYVKLGFQRAMKMSPEIEHRISDMSERLANIERLAGDMADGEFQADSAEAESLKTAINALMIEGQMVVREGLSFDYPDSTAIIPDPACRSLRGFVGANWVAQEYLLTEDEIEEVYMIDVGKGYTAYDENGVCTDRTVNDVDHYAAGGGDSGDDGRAQMRACVWEIYHRKDGVVYVVCDGYSDFLQVPAPPEAEITRWWPWFAFVMNEGYNEKTVYPQSDIDLIKDMQLELNRSRQGLREHRRANRPKTAVAAGVLEEPDKEKLRTHPANALLELNALAPGQKIDDVLQPVKMPPIDPAVYDTAPVWEDVLRVLGSDPADQGNTSGATATEVSVAEFSQNTDTSSIVDDMNDVLSNLARSASEILLLNVTAQTVQNVVGPGAVWPEIDKQTVSDNIWLKVDVGANGPPNRQQDVQMLTQLLPLLQRVPGINPEWMARQLIRRMGDDIDLSEAFTEGLPSVEAMNQLASRPPAPPGGPPAGEGEEGGEDPSGAGKGPPRPPGPANDPNAQGMAGPMNAPASNPPGSIGPRPPPLQVFGRNGNVPGTGGGMPVGAMGRPGMPTP